MTRILIGVLNSALSKRLNLLLGLDLCSVLVLGTVVRLLLMPFTAHPFDVYAWYAYCSSVLRSGLDLTQVLVSLRPLWLLTLALIAYVYGFLSSVTGFRAVPVADLPWEMNPQYGAEFVPDPLFCVLVKAPSLVADIGTTCLLYWLVLRFWGQERAERASLLFFLNPIGIWISAAWGQYEAIPAFFTILSLYFVLNERIVGSALALLVATLYKVYPAVFLLPVLIYLFKKGDRHSLFKYCVVFFSPMLVYLILGGIGAIGALLNFILGFFSSGTFFGLFGHGLTYWSMSMLFPLDAHVWVPLSSVLMVGLLSVSSYYVFKSKFGGALRELSVGTFLLFSAVLLSYRFVGETRVLWLLPFLTLMVVEGVISMKLFGLLSFMSFLYSQKNFPFYLLPLTALNRELILPLFGFAAPFGEVVGNALLPTRPGGLILGFLGTGFSVLLLMSYLRVIRSRSVVHLKVSSSESVL